MNNPKEHTNFVFRPCSPKILVANFWQSWISLICWVICVFYDILLAYFSLHVACPWHILYISGMIFSLRQNRLMQKNDDENFRTCYWGDTLKLLQFDIWFMKKDFVIYVDYHCAVKQAAKLWWQLNSQKPTMSKKNYLIYSTVLECVLL